MKLGLFTDTLEDINGVARFIRDMGERARASGRRFVIHTSIRRSGPAAPGGAEPPYAQKNFDPLISSGMPYYPQQQVALPPAWQMLHWANEEKFDMLHCSTPGPVGLAGVLIARWLGLPYAATYHTDFPAYADRLTRNAVITGGTTTFMRWFYRPAAIVFARSSEYHDILVNLGVPRERLRTIRPAINLERFNPGYRDPSVWNEFGVTEPKRVLFVGRVSVEKNLPLLVKAFRLLRDRRRDVALFIAGDGPYRDEMRRALLGLPAYLPGVLTDRALARLYSSGDVFAFPSRTDTLGQVVMEAQACGMPALVSDEGGPKTIVRDGITGRVVHGEDPAEWAEAIDQMLSDADSWRQMSAAAAERLRRYSLTDTFEDFWAQHEAVVMARSTAAKGQNVEVAPTAHSEPDPRSSLRNVPAL